MSAPTFAERLGDLIAHLDEDAAGTARRLGVSRSMLSKILNGERGVSRNSAVLLLAAKQRLGLREDYWTSDRPPSEFLATSVDRTVAPTAVPAAPTGFAGELAAALAERTGIPPTLVRDVLRAAARPAPEQAALVAQAIDAAITEAFGS